MVHDLASPPCAPAAKKTPSRRPLLWILLCTLAPLIAAFVMYLNPQWWPADGSNYGTLITPQRSVPDTNALRLTTLDGQPFDLQRLHGKWLLVSVDEAACAERCARKLFITRNTHASQGKNVDRLARIWLITDEAPVPEKVLQAYQGTLMLRADPKQLADFLLAADKMQANQTELLAPIWVIDPLGNLMMQYPAEADGVKVRQDITKLLRNSRIG